LITLATPVTFQRLFAARLDNDFIAVVVTSVFVRIEAVKAPAPKSTLRHANRT
jgi:hypothetical protein